LKRYALEEKWDRMRRKSTTMKNMVVNLDDDKPLLVDGFNPSGKY